MYDRDSCPHPQYLIRVNCDYRIILVYLHGTPLPHVDGHRHTVHGQPRPHAADRPSTRPGEPSFGGGWSAGCELRAVFYFISSFIFAVGGLGFVFCVLVAGRSECHFILFYYYY